MKIFVTHPPDALANYYGEAALAALRTHGEVRLNESGALLEPAALIEQAAGCDVIIADRQTAIGPDILDALPDLVAVLRCAVDIRNIDLSNASQNGILVTRASPGFGEAVAELALGMMVDLARGISRSVLTFRTGALPEVRSGIQLSAATLGIIGYGVIGRRLAELSRALGMTVLVSDPNQQIVEPGIAQVPMDRLLAGSDFVVCLAPALPATENLLNAAAFAAMRPRRFFINLSRSSLVDENALEAALESGHLAGAALDVGSAPDQMPPTLLAMRSDVIATPHIGGLTPQAVQHQAFDTVRQAAALAGGRLPDFAVNPAEATRLGRLGVTS